MSRRAGLGPPLSVKLSPEQRLWLDEESLSQGRTVGAIIRQCIDDAMERKPLEVYVTLDRGQGSHEQTKSGKFIRYV